MLVGRSCIVAISTVGILIIPVVITVVIGIWNTVETGVVSTVGRIPMVVVWDSAISKERIVRVRRNSIVVSMIGTITKTIVMRYTLIFLRCSTLFSAVRSC